MEPFSITCTTCKSRLKVRSAAAIGQVVSCPKCGGMVLIKAPDEGMPPEVANAATKPVEQRDKAKPHNTKDFDDVESILCGAAPVPGAAVSRGEQPARNPEKRAAPAVSAVADEEPTVARAAASTSSAIKSPVHEPATAEEDSTPKPALAPQASARRYGMWLALSIVIGIALAAAVVVAGSVFRRGNATVAKNAPAAATKAAPAKSSVAIGDAARGTSPLPNANTISPASAAPAKELPAPASDQEVQPVTPTPNTPPEKSGDPLGIVTPPQASAPSGKAPVAIGADPLGKFGKVLDGGKDDSLPPAEAPAAPTKTGAEAPPADAAPAAPRPAPRSIDVSARLADAIAAIDVPGVPLADFLADMSSLSTIPITLDPTGLTLVGISPLTPVSLKAENSTVGQSLTAALSPLHLEYEIADGQLVVSLGSKLNERSFPVDDLTGKSEEQARQLAEWATTLIEPGIWKDGEEDGASLTPGMDQFAVRASDRTFAGLLLLMEKLRVARGLPLRTKQPAEVFRLQSRSAKASVKLATPISLNYSHPTLLLIILKRLEKESQTRILVDWRALAAEGWNADGEGILSVQAKPLEEALTDLLQPMDLAWRAIDEQTVQVTTPAAVNQTLDLEIYPARKLAANLEEGEALLTRLRNALPPAESEEATGTVRFDPASGSVLASLPQPQQRQVEKLLGEWSK